MKAKFIDYDIVKAMEGEESDLLKNDCVIIEFEDCKFEIRVDKYREKALEIRKIETRNTNSDQINIFPQASNGIVLQ